MGERKGRSPVSLWLQRRQLTARGGSEAWKPCQAGGALRNRFGKSQGTPEIKPRVAAAKILLEAERWAGHSWGTWRV